MTLQRRRAGARRLRCDIIFPFIWTNYFPVVRDGFDQWSNFCMYPMKRCCKCRRVSDPVHLWAVDSVEHFPLEGSTSLRLEMLYWPPIGVVVTGTVGNTPQELVLRMLHGWQPTRGDARHTLGLKQPNCVCQHTHACLLWLQAYLAPPAAFELLSTLGRTTKRLAPQTVHADRFSMPPHPGFVPPAGTQHKASASPIALQRCLTPSIASI